MHLYTLTFRNRKGYKRFSRLRRRRESVASFSTHQTIVGNTFPHLQNFLSSLADAPHCSMWLVSKQNLFISVSSLVPCHAAVCVNFILGAKVSIFTVIPQSTGLIFAPSLPIGKKLGSNSTFLFSKKLCAKLTPTHRVIFFITLIS